MNDIDAIIFLIEEYNSDTYTKRKFEKTVQKMLDNGEISAEVVGKVMSKILKPKVSQVTASGCGGSTSSGCGSTTSKNIYTTNSRCSPTPSYNNGCGGSNGSNGRC